MYHLDQLENIISSESIQNLRNFLEKIKWNYKIDPLSQNFTFEKNEFCDV